ncbi:MAG: hypothetical protein F4106_04935 [Gemmatimonadetes bacterium]|nr:hypothetical protein [Gemmatimonadota bacterium]MXX71228.1 hypothetical protein [Gemmatimonadota bacterium]MYC91032.1 hypothetical protein [Gemmatimonadota bacterium]MYG37113.1 hypothetical protein [Gemmatimonadota bacterium]MYJ17381.1 hypothetical protein [Gemmatimonadota bacterium]
MWTRFPGTSGRRAGHSRHERPVRRGGQAWLLAVPAAVTLSLAACMYSFTAGAGFPDHVRTIAVVPFENETNRFELTQEVHEALLRQLPRSLGLTTAGEEAADAVVTGTILRYELTAPLYRRGQQAETVQVLQREVVLVVRVEVLDRENYTILWDQQQLRVVGQYLDASETEDVGRTEAIELLVQEIVDGAQSNW